MSAGGNPCRIALTCELAATGKPRVIPAKERHPGENRGRNPAGKAEYGFRLSPE